MMKKKPMLHVKMINVHSLNISTLNR